MRFTILMRRYFAFQMSINVTSGKSMAGQLVPVPSWAVGVLLVGP